ncbi:unnamed protein product [Urochloa humidicola]
MDPNLVTQPHSGREEAEPDRLSDLPDDILLRIVGDLGLRALVRASGLSRRWRSVPALLPDLTIDVADFVPRGEDDDGDINKMLSPLMQAYAGAARRLLLAPGAERALTLRTVRLRFLLSEPYILHAIGCAVEDILGQDSKVERLELDLWTATELAGGDASLQQKAMFRRQFISFFDAYPVAFGCLTSLTLQNLCFGSPDVPRLLRSCTRLQLLSLSHCTFGMPAAGCSSIVVVEIDAPRSQLAALEIRFCCFQRVELIQAPELRRFHCDTWYGDNPPVHFGHVPHLRNVTLASNVHRSRTPFALSEVMSSVAGNLSTLDLDFRDGKIWIRPEDLVKKLSFGNLRDVYLHNVYALCDLNWTLFVLEAAPSLKNFYIVLTPHILQLIVRCFMKISRHVCHRNKFPAEVLLDNVRWRTSDFEHHSLQLLEIVGYAEEYVLQEYIRLVMEYAVCLKRIRLLEQDLCSGCGYRPSETTWYRSRHTDRWHYPSTEGEKDRTRSRLMKRCSSPVKIVIG